MRTKTLILSATLLVLLAGVSTAASKLWVHVHVEDAAKEETVKIKLPISVIETMLPIIEQKKLRDGHIKVHDSEFRVEDLRKVWNDIRDEGDMEFVSVQGKDKNIRMYIQGNYLL